MKRSLMSGLLLLASMLSAVTIIGSGYAQETAPTPVIAGVYTGHEWVVAVSVDTFEEYYITTVPEFDMVEAVAAKSYRTHCGPNAWKNNAFFCEATYITGAEPATMPSIVVFVFRERPDTVSVNINGAITTWESPSYTTNVMLPLVSADLTNVGTPPQPDGDIVFSRCGVNAFLLSWVDNGTPAGITFVLPCPGDW